MQRHSKLHISGKWKANNCNKGLHITYHNSGPISKGAKDKATKSTENCCFEFDYILLFDTPSRGNLNDGYLLAFLMVCVI